MTHQSPKTHRDPPEPRLLDNGYLVEPEPVDERVPYSGWEPGPDWTPPRFRLQGSMGGTPERPVAHPVAVNAAWFGLGVCVGVLLLALLILGRAAIDGVGS